MAGCKLPRGTEQGSEEARENKGRKKEYGPRSGAEALVEIVYSREIASVGSRYRRRFNFLPIGNGSIVLNRKQ